MNVYSPLITKIVDIIDEAFDIKTFVLERPKEFNDFKPGMFVMISVFGYGEAPFAVASSPYDKKYLEVSVRRVGNVTNALHRLKVGDYVGIRGPYGNGFPVEGWEGMDIIVIAGGTGLFGVSSLLWYLYENTDAYGSIKLLYGARTPQHIPRKRNLDTWATRFNVYLTVDKPDENWKGEVGVVTRLLDKIVFDGKRTIFVLCGPPIMLYNAYMELLKRGVQKEQIYLSLERRMQCGIGKCGACLLDSGYYVCRDGPIFRADQLLLGDIA